MTRPIKIKGKYAEICVECGMCYNNKKLAEKCEKWCNRYGACNLKIIKKAIKLREK